MDEARTQRLARSYLFAPGDNEKLLRKVFTAGADAVVLDLEDAVAPARKAQARALVAQVLGELTVGQTLVCPDLIPPALSSPANSANATTGQTKVRPTVYVRINAVVTPFWQMDLATAVHRAVRGVRLAKAESLTEVQVVDEELAKLETERELPVGALRVVPTIESAAGLLNAAELARHPRVEAFSFGAADFVKDIGAEADETATLFARSQLVVLSRAAGINPPIAAVYTRLNDAEGLRASTEAQRRLGFFGRSCIHPTQLAIVHEVFTPKPQAIHEARAIVQAFEAAQATGMGVATLANGQFIDAPIVERARALLALAEQFD